MEIFEYSLVDFETLSTPKCRKKYFSVGNLGVYYDYVGTLLPFGGKQWMDNLIRSEFHPVGVTTK